MKKDTFLVTGGTGTIGRQVISELLNAGKNVRMLTRDSSKVLPPNNVEISEGDLNTPDTLKGALKGVIGVHLISFGDENYTPLAKGKQIVETIEEAGVKRLTILWNGEGNESSLEKEIKSSSMEWTVLQPQEYMSNALGWAESIIERSEVKEPFGDRPTAAIHEADVGSVIAEILINGGHSQQIYTLTGPEVLTPRKQVQEIASALGREIKFIEMDEKQTRARWKEWGLPDETMDYLYEWYRNTPAQGSTVTTVVENIINRPPRSFKEWIQKNSNAFDKQCSV